MNFVDIDYSKAPLIVLKYNNVKPTEETFAAYLAAMEDFHVKYKNVVLIFDGTTSAYLPAEYRIKQGKWIKENEHKWHGNLKGMIFIIPNMVTRLILDGIFLVKKPSDRYVVVKSMADAQKEAEKMMKELF